MAAKEWKTACNLVFKHEELQEELKMSLAKAISEEFESYFNRAGRAGRFLKQTTLFQRTKIATEIFRRLRRQAKPREDNSQSIPMK